MEISINFNTLKEEIFHLSILFIIIYPPYTRFCNTNVTLMTLQYNMPEIFLHA